MNNTALLPFRVYNPDNHDQSVDVEAFDWMEASQIGLDKLGCKEVGVTFTGPR